MKRTAQRNSSHPIPNMKLQSFDFPSSRSARFIFLSHVQIASSWTQFLHYNGIKLNPKSIRSILSEGVCWYLALASWCVGHRLFRCYWERILKTIHQSNEWTPVFESAFHLPDNIPQWTLSVDKPPERTRARNDFKQGAPHLALALSGSDAGTASHWAGGPCGPQGPGHILLL